MLSYQSKAEEAFYLRLLKEDYEFLRLPREHPFTISKFSLAPSVIDKEFNEKIFEEGNEFLNPSHDSIFTDYQRVVNVSFERGEEITSCLNKMLLELNIELKMATSIDKEWLINRYLENANYFNTQQQKIIDKDPNKDVTYGLYEGTINLGPSNEISKDELRAEKKDHKYRKIIFKEEKPYGFIAQLNIKILNPLIIKLIAIKKEINFSDKKGEIKKVFKNLETVPGLIKDGDEYIDPLFKDLLIAAENRATVNRTFKHAIRCAAFCEMLYEKKYLLNKRDMGPVIKAFALVRYNKTFKSQLDFGKIKQRTQHKNGIVSRQPPLKTFF